VPALTARQQAANRRRAAAARRGGAPGFPGWGGGSNLSAGREWAWLTGAPYPLAPPPAGEREAMGLPPFGRGVALLANAVADTEWHAASWDADSGIWQRRADQPNVLTDTNPLTTEWEYKWAAIEDGILFGNHFAFYGDPDPNFGNWPSFLVPIPADQVWVLANPDNPAFWQWTIGGITYSPADIFHVSFGNRSGEVLGRGVLYQYGEALGGIVAAEQHAGKYFAGGALPPAVLQSPTVLTQDQADDLKTRWREMTSSREPVVLPSGYVLTPVVSNAEQAQLVESRTFNAEQAAMILGIPSYKLGLPGATMTYQNVETADIDFIRDSVTRYASPLAASFTKWLMPRGTDVRFDWTGRMRADQKSTAEVLTALTGADILTDDEARAVLGRPPLHKSTDAGTTPEDVPELTPSEVT
jgi:HK97 family phage portal protein